MPEPPPLPEPSPLPETLPLTLHASAARMGAFCWTERRLFESLGASLSVLSDPSAKVMADRHAAHAAWRAEQWWERLPVLAVVDRDDLVAPETPGTAALYDALGEEPGEIGLLAGFYRVALPRLAAAYRAYEAVTSPVSDGPARRTLRHVLADLEGDRAEGEDFVHLLLVDAQAVRAASAAVSRLERLLLPASRRAGR